MRDREEERASNRTARELSHHILPASGTMIGVCTTIVGLVKIMEGRSGASRVDMYGALIAVLFLASAVLSYVSIRTAERRPRLARRCERFADGFFLSGLLCIVGLMALFAFETL